MAATARVMSFALASSTPTTFTNSMVGFAAARLRARSASYACHSASSSRYLDSFSPISVAAFSPRSVSSSDLRQSSPVRPMRSGSITTSADFSALRMPGIIIVSIVLPITPKRLSLAFSATATSAATSTATTTSAPICRTTSAGMLLSVPPSTSSILSICTGVNTAGMAMVARMARERFPLSSTTDSDLFRSVATQRNGVGRSSKDSSTP